MFSFQMSKDVVTLEKKTLAAFKSVAKHLNDNPDKMLMLSGGFGSNEKNETDFDNLGMARAEEIKEKLVDLKVSPNQINTKGERVDNLSFRMIDKKQHMMGGVNFLFTNGASDNSTSDASETNEATTNTVSFSANTPMTLNISNKNFDLDDNADFQTYMTGLAAYIKDNPKKKILIASYNDEEILRSRIRRDVRTYMKDKLGYITNQFSKFEGSASESPSGEACVSVGIE